jgi:hypothetical protein
LINAQRSFLFDKYFDIFLEKLLAFRLIS